MSTTDAPDTKRRAQAIALELFSRNGYDGTSMRLIAEELGVTKAALYYHFAGKEDIVRGIIDDFLASADRLVEWTRTDPRPDPEQVLRRWAAVLRNDGLQLIRFLQANQRIVRDLDFDGSSMRDRLAPLSAALAPDDQSLDGQFRARLAMFAVQGAGFFTQGMDATDDQVFDIAVQVALEVLAGGRRPAQ